jgi:hypothetical protein
MTSTRKDTSRLAGGVLDGTGALGSRSLGQNRSMIGVRKRTSPWSGLARFGQLIYEETSVKTDARRSRDFPHIYSASSAIRSAMKECTVAPIHASGVAMRQCGRREATWIPLSILT